MKVLHPKLWVITTKNEGGGFPWMLVKSFVGSHPNIPHVYNYHSLAHDPNFHGKIISVVGQEGYKPVVTKLTLLRVYFGDLLLTSHG